MNTNNDSCIVIHWPCRYQKDHLNNRIASLKLRVYFPCFPSCWTVQRPLCIFACDASHSQPVMIKLGTWCTCLTFLNAGKKSKAHLLQHQSLLACDAWIFYCWESTECSFVCLKLRASLDIITTRGGSILAPKAVSSNPNTHHLERNIVRCSTSYVTM